MSPRDDGRAREVARLVAKGGWPVIPMRIDVDDKVPCVRWKNDPGSVCRSEADVVNDWPPTWPRWATICGEPRELDGRALVCLDADSKQAADVARSLLHDYTRVRTGRSGGEHTWAAVPADFSEELLRRFYLAKDLDWRGGDCIALLPGSLWAPLRAPEVTYEHLSGPALPEVLDIPAALASFVFKCSQRQPGRARGTYPTTSPSTIHSGLPGRPHPGELDLNAGGAFEKFLAAVTRSGRIVKRVPRCSGEAFVQCPGTGHPDQNRNRPCLHVTARGGGIGLHCFGARGCTAEEIVAALGLTKADLYDDLSGLEFTFIDSRADVDPRSTSG